MKRIVNIGLLLSIGIHIMAQPMEIEGIDTVTIGSKVTYQVIPDPVVAAFPNMNPSHFDWYFTDINNNLITIPDGGINLDETRNGSSGFYEESTIHVLYNAALHPAGTNIKLKVAEVSQPQIGTGCTGNTEEIRIFFVPVPTISVNGTSGGGCALQYHDIPLSITGYGPFNVTFTVEKDGSGNLSTFTETLGSVSNKGGSTHAINLRLTAVEHITGGDGQFDIVITNITDRFSKNSTVTIPGIVTSSDYTIGIYPIPDIQEILHIRNL